MHSSIPHCLPALTLFSASLTSHGAEAFAAPGAKATLTVEYVFESAGKKRSEGLYDPYEWRAKRSASLSADLAAQLALPTPTMQALDSAQTADLQNKQVKAQAMATTMAPMMADAEKVIAKCGDDDACITREAQKMGAAMAGTPQLATAQKVGKEAQEAFTPGAPRYQAWRSTLQKGSYTILETAHISVTDPICTSRPRHRCTRDEVRKGSGEIPLPPQAKKNPAALSGFSGVEIDMVKNTLTVQLPVPLFPLPYIETITTDEPEGTHDTPTPRGPQQKSRSFGVNAKSGATNDKPFTVPLKGGWRSQSGEQVITQTGEFGEGGQLTVRWRFVVQ